ncbi:MAG TPA: hypothetical protein VNZ52_09055 [Candidatus Thermoplasmatota archaeon]|nr:hypothetical protein [Candidatus Thermoplasmatota archaeon]
MPPVTKTLHSAAAACAAYAAGRTWATEWVAGRRPWHAVTESWGKKEKAAALAAGFGLAATALTLMQSRPARYAAITGFVIGSGLVGKAAQAVKGTMGQRDYQLFPVNATSHNPVTPT